MNPLKHFKVFGFLLLSICIFTFPAAGAEEVAEPPPLLERDETTTTPKVEPKPKKEGLLEDASDAVSKATDKAVGVLAETRQRRTDSDYYILGNYAPLDLILPGKYGVSLGSIRTADVSWEFEYLHGSVAVPFLIEDLGSMSDDRFSLIRRSYFGSNSFNFSYGLTYFDFSVHLGDKLLSKLSGNNYPSVDLVELQAFGFNVGVGNRWTFKHNITLGVDWISWAQPVIVTKKDAAFLDYANNADDKDDVKTAVNVISYFPRLSLLKVQLGILF